MEDIKIIDLDAEKFSPLPYEFLTVNLDIILRTGEFEMSCICHL